MPSRRPPSVPRLLIAVMLLSSCSDAGAGSGGTAPLPVVPTTAPASTATTPAPTTSDTLPGGEGFLGALESVLSGTGFEGTVAVDRDAFLEAGSGVCSLLGRGLSVDDVLLVLAVTLRLDQEESLDEVVLAAGLVGAATAHLCPEHADRG